MGWYVSEWEKRKMANLKITKPLKIKRISRGKGKSLVFF